MRILHVASDAILHPAFLHGHDIKEWTKQHKPSKTILGHMMLLCVQIIFSVHNLTGRYAMMYVSPSVYMSIRLVVGAPIMLGLAGCVDKKELLVRGWKDHLCLAGIGFFGMALNPLCFMYGLKFAAASVGAVITPSQVAFTFAVSVILKREKASLLKVLGVVIALGGVMLGMQPDKMDVKSMIGPLCFLGSGLCNAVFFTLQGPLLKRLAPEIVTAWAFFYAAIPLLTLSLAMDFDSVQALLDGSIPRAVYVCIVFAVLFVQVGAFNMISFGVKYSGSPTVASAYSLLTPVITILLCIVIAGEPFVWMQALGCGVTIAGLIVLIIGRQRETRQAAANATAYHQVEETGDEIEMSGKDQERNNGDEAAGDRSSDSGSIDRSSGAVSINLSAVARALSPAPLRSIVVEKPASTG